MSPPDPNAVPGEPLARPKTVWQRWMAWNGSFLIISILAHLFLIGGAALLVVQVLHPREKLKFTAAPPNSAGSKEVEHQVKAAKKKASMSEPAITKRITTTAANVSVALPPMDMAPSMPDMMSSVMSGMGAGGLGAGAGTSGGTGMGAMPPGGMTAFGFKSATAGTLVGTFFDMKQSSYGKPNTMDLKLYLSEIDRFVRAGMSEYALSKYFRAPDKIYSSQFFVPKINAEDGPAAFKAKNTDAWLIHYQGVVIPSVSGTYRFWGVGDDIMTVQLDGRVVMNYGCFLPAKVNVSRNFRVYDGLTPYAWCKGLGEGTSFEVIKGKSYPIDVLIGHEGRGFTMAILLIEKDGEQYNNDSHGNPILPIFKLMRREFKKPAEQSPVFIPDTDYSVWNAELSKQSR